MVTPAMHPQEGRDEWKSQEQLLLASFAATPEQLHRHTQHETDQQGEQPYDCCSDLHLRLIAPLSHPTPAGFERGATVDHLD
jgi:hypothetical protein